MNITVIVPTCGREETRDALESIADQSCPPDEVIVIDEDIDSPVRDFVSDVSFHGDTSVRYVQRQCGGLTRAKNFAGAEANGDVVVFLDDDAALHGDAIENLIEVYRKHEPDGVWLITDERHSTVSVLFSKIFRHGPFRYGLREAEQYPEETGEFEPLDAMGGCGMSIRDYVLDEFEFDPQDTVAFLPEDIDFSYRVARKYRIGATAKARKHHKQLKRKEQLGEELRTASYRKVFAYNYLYLVTLDARLRYLPHYVLVNVGLAIGAIYVALRRRDPSPILGTFAGYGQLLRGRTVYEEYLESE